MFGLKRQRRNERTLRLIDDKAPFNFIEAYKSIRTNIEFLASTNGYHSFVITSAGPWDGKTTVAINLAVAMGGSGKKVLLVDCDLRKASIANYLRISRRLPGISSVLAGKITLPEVIVHRPDLHIDVLPVGVLPSNPSEIIGSAAMVGLLQTLSEMYDYVFIDTPPVSVVTDAAVMSRFVDGVLLVVRSDETTKQAMNLSKKNLEDVDARILGVILNDYNAKNHSYGSNSYYSYSYKYGSYGEKNDKGRKKK